MRMAMLIAAAVSLPVAAQAQTPGQQTQNQPTAPAQPAYVEPEADRVEAARALLEILMPQAERDAMILAMMEPMMANLQAGMMQSPGLEDAFAATPGAQDLFVEFMASQRAHALQTATASLPGMMEAMARAYARRFTRRQMREIGDFFGSDVGQAYVRQANTIMADPDIAVWQRQTMAQSMQQLETEIPQFMARLAALQGGGTGTSPAPANRSVTDSNLDAMRSGGDRAATQPPGEQEGEE